MAKEIFISDIDNAKDKGAMINRLLVEKLRDRPIEEVVSTLVAFMSLDDREDAVVSICGVIR